MSVSTFDVGPGGAIVTYGDVIRRMNKLKRGKPETTLRDFLAEGRKNGLKRRLWGAMGLRVAVTRQFQWSGPR